MIVTHFIKLFRSGAERHNILMSLLFLVAEGICVAKSLISGALKFVQVKT